MGRNAEFKKNYLMYLLKDNILIILNKSWGKVICLSSYPCISSL